MEIHDAANPLATIEPSVVNSTSMVPVSDVKLWGSGNDPLCRMSCVLEPLQRASAQALTVT
jgi:hypothetical protein